MSRRGARDDSDIVAWDIGSSGDPPIQLLRKWDVIVNAAADTRWTMSVEDARQANVATVDALRRFVDPETLIVHISTAYAVGLAGDVSSTEPGDYRNTYEWSKACAERLVRETFPSATIVRPTLIVGRRTDGRAARFAGIYALLRGIASSTVPAVVSTPTSYIDIVPVDDLARVIADVMVKRQIKGGELLTVASGKAAPRVQDAVTTMVSTLNFWRDERGCRPLEPPRIISPDSWERFFLPFVRRHLSPRQRQIIELLRNYEPYLRITKPLHPTHQILDVESCLVRSVRYWADTNERVACLPARPWNTGQAIGAGAG